MLTDVDRKPLIRPIATKDLPVNAGIAKESSLGPMNSFGVAIIGCGTVGGATAALLHGEGAILGEKVGNPIELRHVIDIDFARAIELGIDESICSADISDALNDPEVQCVVELVGGTTIAYEFTKMALAAGKHVVTANKALLAHHGTELFALAHKNDVTIAFEASCAGGIPIVRALYDGLIANRIDALYGIVNGTCNYILTAMDRYGQSYNEALRLAQKNGLAEADPTLDVSGGDSAHKLTILGSLAFGRSVDIEKIPVEGIDTLDALDVAFGKELGYVAKLLAVAQRRDDGISFRVRPSFIGVDHPLAWVSGPFNAISVYGSVVGHTMYYGRGAGGVPTSSAIVADILSIAVGSYAPIFRSLALWSDRTEPAKQLPVENVTSRYYIRVTVDDKPGVFARISSILGDKEISISSVLQKEPEEETEHRAVPVVITTHLTTEGRVLSALEEIDSESFCAKPGIYINIIDEHEESI